ncbi:MAG: hypothetical protein OSJ76_01775 [Alphaproteobacteria bacterium]|nr:hypothetical protein [Alphaproteobacteria bacterium]
MSLTEDWKDGKLLKCERYWVKSPVFIGAKPAFLNIDNSFDVDGTIYPVSYHLEVLASCNYKKLQSMKDLLRDCRKQLQSEAYNPDTDTVYNSVVNLIKRINTALGESEE